MPGYGRGGARHAGHLYRDVFRWLRHPVHAVEGEAAHLREVEEAGEAGETPYIAILGVFLFLAPVLVVLMGLGFLAGHLAG